MYNFFTALIAFVLTNFYSLQFSDTDGNTVSMNGFQNKKILIVNIATGNGQRIGQLAGLQQLQQQYGDSLVVIVFPSNSFGNESRTNSQIKQFCQENYGATFRIAEKTNVTGNDVHPVFNWLSAVSENGVMNVTVAKDFQKFLIGKDGSLAGIFSPSVDPMSQEVISAITEN